MIEIVETAFQYGTCARCGQDVERDNPGHLWHDFYGRDRCRSDWDDGQCDVTEIHNGVRLAKRVVTEVTTVTLIRPDGETAVKQLLQQGVNWQEYFAEPIVISALLVSREKSRYLAELTPGEEAEYLADRKPAPPG